MSESSQRPPGFAYGPLKGSSSNVLNCEGVSLPQLADRFGTPLYVYSAEMIRERVSAFNIAFRGIEHTICYSVKANSNLSILRLLARLGCGFDVVSGGELQRVLRTDHKSAKKVVFSGVGKTIPEIEAALKANILLQCGERIGASSTRNWRCKVEKEGKNRLSRESGCACRHSSLYLYRAAQA